MTEVQNSHVSSTQAVSPVQPIKGNEAPSVQVSASANSNQERRPTVEALNLNSVASRDYPAPATPIIEDPLGELIRGHIRMSTAKPPKIKCGQPLSDTGPLYMELAKIYGIGNRVEFSDFANPPNGGMSHCPYYNWSELIDPVIIAACGRAAVAAGISRPPQDGLSPGEKRIREELDRFEMICASPITSAGRDFKSNVRILMEKANLAASAYADVILKQQLAVLENSRQIKEKNLQIRARNEEKRRTDEAAEYAKRKAVCLSLFKDRDRVLQLGKQIADGTFREGICEGAALVCGNLLVVNGMECMNYSGYEQVQCVVGNMFNCEKSWRQ